MQLQCLYKCLYNPACLRDLLSAGPLARYNPVLQNEMKPLCSLSAICCVLICPPGSNHTLAVVPICITSSTCIGSMKWAGHMNPGRMDGVGGAYFPLLVTKQETRLESKWENCLNISPWSLNTRGLFPSCFLFKLTCQYLVKLNCWGEKYWRLWVSWQKRLAILSFWDFMHIPI